VKSNARHRKRSWLPFFIVSILTLAFLIVFFWTDIFIIIRSGEAGVLWNRFMGTRTDRVYREGLHIISPLDRMHIFEVRKQVVTHELTVLSVDGLQLELHLAIRFRPELNLLGMLHDRIGPEYLTRVVIPQTESVLRKQLGNATAEQIYTNDNGLLTRAMLKAMEEIGRNFVEMEDIIIRRIRLPETVRQAIEDKLVQQQLLESYQFRGKTAIKEAERKRIEAAGARDYNDIVKSTLSDRLLNYQGIQATSDIAESQNPKTIVIGAGENSPPIILGNAHPDSVVPQQDQPPATEQ
jgi:prohibitin 1